MTVPASQPGAVARRRWGWLWTLVAPLSLGLLSFLPPIWFGARDRRRSGFVWGGVFLAAFIAFVVVEPESEQGFRDSIATGIFVSTWLGGTAVGIVMYVTGMHESDELVMARRRRDMRARARALALTDPKLAVEAHVGRPDIPGDHRDGGLVDVNRVPASALAALPGISAELAHRVVLTRAQVGGFSSLPDLIGTLGISPVELRDAQDYLVFLPL